jgi:hypothetical protein
MVLRAGRRRVGNLTPLEFLVEAVELRQNEFAAAVVLGACGLRLLVCARVAAALPPADGGAGCAAAGDRCCRSTVAVPRADVLAGRDGGHPRWLDPGDRCPAARPVEQGRQGAQEGNKPGFGGV